MVTEEGIVIELDARSAWVKATKTGACEACSARSSCNVMGGGKEMKVHATNELGAKVDDRVVVSFETASLLKASFLLYILPVLGLIIGAFSGQALAPSFHLDASVASIVAAFLFFLVIVVGVKTRGERLAEKREYQPKIVRIINPTINDAAEKRVAN